MGIPFLRTELSRHSVIYRLVSGPALGRPLARIVVGLIADVFPIGIGGEGHAEIGELDEGTDGTGRLGQSGVAVDAAARK